LPQTAFHDLRHTFASLMLLNREHPKVVQEMIGHTQISTTLDTYSYVLPDMRDEAVKRFGSLFS
jgi:integrase